MRRKIFALAGVAVLTATSACAGNTDDDGRKKVTVGAIPIVDVAPLHLGVEKGFFKDRGINIDVKNTTGGAEAVPGVYKGKFDFAFGNVTSLILAREKDLPVKVISNGVTTSGEDGKDFGGIVVRKDSDISSPKDLAGKEVAVNNQKNIGDTTVRNSVREDGGDSKDVKFTEMPFPDMPPTMKKGDLEAAWMVEPALTTAIDDGAKEIASNFVDADPNLAIASYFTSEEMISKDPKLVEDFTAAIHESMKYADENPDEVRRVLTEYTDMDEQIVEEIRLPTFPTDPNRKSAQKLADMMEKDGTVKSKPNVDELFQKQ